MNKALPLFIPLSFYMLELDSSLSTSHSEKGHRIDTSCRFYQLDGQVVETTCIKFVDKTISFASTLLTTCSRLVIMKLEYAMRTHSA